MWNHWVLQDYGEEFTSHLIPHICIHRRHQGWILWISLYHAAAATVWHKIWCYCFASRNFLASLFKFAGHVPCQKSFLWNNFGLIYKNKMAAKPFLCWKMPFFYLACSLQVKFESFYNYYVGLIYIHELLICKHLTLRLFVLRHPGGVQVPHRGSYVLGCISSLIICPIGLGCSAHL